MNNNKMNNRKVNINNSNEEPAQQRSYLADLFKTPEDKVDAEAERDVAFGYTPRNTNKLGSFTIR